MQEDKCSTSGLKRTLSEGYEKDGKSGKREGKRPRMEREELEAQLEFKITAKAGSHHKLEKVCMQNPVAHPQSVMLRVTKANNSFTRSKTLSLFALLAQKA